ncbi:MAG: SRPBCC domain-containing protein, partial [Veillonella sp.]|nr:SRPBCC domain-containing protein [Veillonella sp.]
MNTTMNAINWPKEYLPGLTDNYVSNEVIVKGITVEAVWEYLTNAATWPSYYSNSSDIKMLNQEDTHLISNTRFFFKTFGFPVDAEVVEYVAPSENQPGRISWHGWAGEVGTAER